MFFLMTQVNLGAVRSVWTAFGAALHPWPLTHLLQLYTCLSSVQSLVTIDSPG